MAGRGRGYKFHDGCKVKDCRQTRAYMRVRIPRADPANPNGTKWKGIGVYLTGCHMFVPNEAIKRKLPRGPDGKVLPIEKGKALIIRITPRMLARYYLSP